MLVVFGRVIGTAISGSLLRLAHRKQLEGETLEAFNSWIPSCRSKSQDCCTEMETEEESSC